MLKKGILPLAVSISLVLSACNSQQTSVDRNARHVAQEIAQNHFDPNTRPLTADNIRVMKPVMQQFYDIGKRDQASGMTPVQAMERALLIGTSGIIQGGDKAMYAGQTYTVDDPITQQKMIAKGATASYLDGYNGVP
ncbi:hypothetical protein BS639_14840 [Rouxiella silvae]|uniref:Exc2 family lipoprotein n=1 Tax=Rouxiella silvae TaxID=1646373 RepID=A0AA41BW12_9GAMM|nr:Exc2 family lipoprotein [Rouxiella silvae]MBF6636541.1 Exc2 family lipoprotein [Rouxiella silvae]ORJ20471.1 hypothetical protein BS639_14840 [Rouxiella silvae]